MSFPTLTVECSSNGSEWTARPTAYPSGEMSDGVGARIGQAVISEAQPASGDSYLPDGSLVAKLDALEIGSFVRVLAITGYDASGTAETSERWLGVIVDRNISADATTRAYECRSLGWLLDQFRVTKAFTESNTWPTIYQLDDWPVFNEHGFGNASASAMPDFLGGRLPYYHQPGSGNYWTAGNVLDLMLAQFMDKALAEDENAIVWDYYVSGATATAAAARVAEFDVRGRTLLQIVAMLFDGWCVWRIVPDGDAGTVVIQLGGDSSETVDASEQSTIIDRWKPAGFAAKDEVHVRSTERPLCTVSLYADDDDSGSLQPDWTSSEETAWEAEPENPAYAHVFGRWRLVDDWNGESGTSDSNTGPGIRSTSDGDLDDNRAWSATMPLPQLLEFAGGAAVVDGDGLPTLEPIGIWLGDTDISERCAFAVGHDHNGPLIEIRYQPEFGGNGASYIQEAIAAGDNLVVTIALREPTRRRAIWRASSLPRPFPRIVAEDLPGRHWYVAPTAKLRSSWGSTSGSILSENDLEQRRDYLVAEHYGPDAPTDTIEIELQGTIDPSASPEPGDTVTVTGSILSDDGQLGPARVLERVFIVRDPKQATRLLCGRMELFA